MADISHPPEGTPEYEEWAAQNKAPAIMLACWFVIALASVFVIGRYLIRLRLYRQLRSDDYWCLGGLVAAYLAAAFTTVAVDLGNGRHFNLLTKHQQERVIFWTVIAFCPSILSFALPKLAVVALLTRLLNPSRFHKWFLWGMGVFCLLTLLATIGTLVGQCLPPESQWNFDIEGKCAPKEDIIKYSLYAGAFSAFVDVYLAVYPAVVLFKLQMKLRKKVALIVALGIGCVSGGFAIYKTTQIPHGLGSPDFSYDSSDLIVWTLVEGCSLIIACTIPVLSPLMEMLFKGRNPFRTTPRGKKYYEDLSHQRRTDGAASMGTSRRSRRKLTDPNTTTIDETDSQTLVLTKLPKGATKLDTSIRSSRNFSRPSRAPNDGILRTDEVTLTFNSDRSRSPSP